MDLSKLSTEDLKALQAGDLSKVSSAGLLVLRGAPEPPKSQAAEDTGRLSALGIGAGRKTDAILDGITQMYLGARGEGAALGALDEKVRDKEALYKPLAEKYPIVTGVGEATPSLVGGVGGLMRSVLASAVPELLSYGSAEERMKRGAIGAAGGALGYGIGQGIGRLLRPAGQGAGGLSDEATNAAGRVGYNLSAGQRSQNPAMQAFENYLARSPGSSSAMQARNAANQTALNRAGAQAMGQSADTLDEGVFSAAKNAIGSEFDRLQQVTAPQLGNDFLNAVATVEAKNSARGSFRSAKIDKLIDQSLDLAVQGKLTGAAYKEIRSELSSSATAAFKAGDATLGQAYKSVRSALDEAAEQSLGAADKKAWALAREQWQAYKALTKSNVAEAGNLSAPRLAAAIRAQGDGLRTGAARGPLADVARIGEAVKGVPNPTSGQLTQQMLYGNPVTGIPMVAGNKVAEVLYQLPMMQKYLADGLVNIGENGQLVVNAAARPAGLPLAKRYLGAE